MDSKILDFNQDQLLHVGIFQQLVQRFTESVLREAPLHDRSKFSAEEYLGFLQNVTALRSSKDGYDKKYQEGYKSDAIQHHVTTNRHHPEYWDARKLPMPITDVIHMYFDWMSRTIQKGDMETFDKFWKYNLEKLQSQPHAVAIVEALRREFPPEAFRLEKDRVSLSPPCVHQGKKLNFSSLPEDSDKCPACGTKLGRMAKNIAGSPASEEEWVHP